MTILHKAAEIVDADREQTYGNPGKNLRTIAAMWTAWLHAQEALQPDMQLDEADVACMMTLLKLARLSNNPQHEDSQVDACGYLYLLSKLRKKDE